MSRPTPLHRCWASNIQRALALIAATALLSSSSGCSYAFSRGPRVRVDAPESPEPGQTVVAECTTSAAPALVDSIFGSFFLGAGVLSLGAAASDGSGFSAAFVPPALLSAILGAVFLTSAVTGYGRASDCRRLKQNPGTEPTLVKEAARASTSAPGR